MARAIDADIAMQKIREYMEDFPNAHTRLAACRAILSMLGDKNQIPTLPPQWISVEERLPEENKRVLVYVNGPGSMEDTDRLMNGRWVRWLGRVTHWMPLPDPPNGKEAPHE